MMPKERARLAGPRSFELNGVTYTVRVWWQVSEEEEGGEACTPHWAWMIEDDRRGTLERGRLDTDDPWAEIERMFPEAVIG